MRLGLPVLLVALVLFGTMSQPLLCTGCGSSRPLALAVFGIFECCPSPPHSSAGHDSTDSHGCGHCHHGSHHHPEPVDRAPEGGDRSCHCPKVITPAPMMPAPTPVAIDDPGGALPLEPGTESRPVGLVPPVRVRPDRIRAGPGGDGSSTTSALCISRR